MQRLETGQHVYFTESILKTLASNRITTIIEFLQEDTEKLSTLTKLSFPQVLEIRHHILSKFSAPLINGTSLLENRATKRQCLSTGIQSLDAIIGGGIPTGFITEICGLPESGKTQLCLQLAVNCVKNCDNTLLYINTKGDFSAIRIQKVLDACGYSYKAMAQIMFQIRIVNIWSMDEMVEFLKKLKSKELFVKNLGLIIIDSLPCLMFQHLGDDNKVGLALLNTLVNYSRYLSKEMNIAIVCVNIQTRWIDQDIIEDDDAEQSTISKDHTERRNRCLGKYWEQIPAVVLMLEKAPVTDNSITEFQVKVIQSFNSKNLNKKCVLKISNLGVNST